MAITKLNSLAIPPDTVVESDISFPLDSASFTGDLTVDTDTLVVDSTNDRIGIGEANPAEKLHISGTGTQRIRITEEGSANFTQILQTSSNTSIVAGQATGDNEIAFLTASAGAVTEKLRLDSDGHLGLGTGSATTIAAPIDIYKNSDSSDRVIRIRNTKYGSGDSSGETALTFGWSNHEAAAIKAFKEGTVNRTGFHIVGEAGYNVPTTIATFRSTGRAGINETNPLATFCVRGTSTNSSLEVNSNSGGATIEVINRSAGGAQTFGLYALGGAITFNTGSPYAERVRIDNNGLKFNGDTAAANALDDYEEGTWTPAFVNGTFTYVGQYGRYTKIGDTIIANCSVQYSSKSGTGQALITLPFTAQSNRFGVSLGYLAGLDNNQIQISAGGNGGTNTIVFWKITNQSSPQQSLVQNMASSGEIQFSCVYQVAT